MDAEDFRPPRAVPARRTGRDRTAGPLAGRRELALAQPSLMKSWIARYVPCTSAVRGEGGQRPAFGTGFLGHRDGGHASRMTEAWREGRKDILGGRRQPKRRREGRKGQGTCGSWKQAELRARAREPEREQQVLKTWPQPRVPSWAREGHWETEEATGVSILVQATRPCTDASPVAQPALGKRDGPSNNNHNDSKHYGALTTVSGWKCTSCFLSISSLNPPKLTRWALSLNLV